MKKFIENIEDLYNEANNVIKTARELYEKVNSLHLVEKDEDFQLGYMVSKISAVNSVAWDMEEVLTEVLDSPARYTKQEPQKLVNYQRGALVQLWDEIFEIKEGIEEMGKD